MIRVLLVQSQEPAARSLSRYFEQRGDIVATVLDVGKAAAMITQFKPDLALVDMHFQADEWQTFLRLTRVDFPDLKIIITHRHPDVQREIRARQLGINAFVRYPISYYYMEKALGEVGISSVSGETRPSRRQRQTGAARSMPLHMRITLPYLILSVLFAGVTAFLISRLLMDAARERFDRLLLETRIQAADWMVSEEENLLQVLRVMTNTEGVAEATRAKESDSLRLLLLPLAVNHSAQIVEVLDLDGVSLFTARKADQGGPADYSFTRGSSTLREEGFVQSVLTGAQDELGDKFVGYASTSYGDYLFLAGPIYDEQGIRVGALLVGSSVDGIITGMEESIGASVTIYDLQGQPAASRLFEAQQEFPLATGQVQSILSGQDGFTHLRQLNIQQKDYSEVLGPWEVRGGKDIGILGVAVEQNYLVGASQLMHVEVFVVLAVLILLIIASGFYLSDTITAPLKLLRAASGQLEKGNLEVKVNVDGADEMTALASSFNRMVSGLQENSLCRDLLGRTPTDQEREILKNRLRDGTLTLQGHSQLATVMTIALPEFNRLAEQMEPELVFEFLGQYHSMIEAVIARHNGVILNADAGNMVVVFGVLPVIQSLQQSGYNCYLAGLEILTALDDMNNQRRAHGELPLTAILGGSAGNVVAGAVGSGEQMRFSIIGEAVRLSRNVASVGASLVTGGGLIVTEFLHEIMQDNGDEFEATPVHLPETGVRTRLGRLYHITGRKVAQEARRE